MTKISRRRSRNSRRRSGWIRTLRLHTAGLADAYSWAGFNEGSLYCRGSDAQSRKRRPRELSNWTTIQPKLTPPSPYSDGSTNLIGRAARANFSAHSHSIQTTRSLTISSAWCSRYQGRLDEGVAEGKRAAELDPLSPQIPVDAVFTLAWKGDYAAAIELARRAADLDPTNFLLHSCSGGSISNKGKSETPSRNCEIAAAMQAPSVRCRLARVRLWRVRRSRARARADRGTEQAVAARIRSAVQPGDRLPGDGG